MPGKRFLEQIREQGSGTLRLSALFASALPKGRACGLRLGGLTYPLTVRVVERLQLYNVGMAYNPHNLQLAVLGKGISDGNSRKEGPARHTLKRLS